MGKAASSLLFCYGATVLAMGLALAVERFLWPMIEPNICPLFLAVIMITAWYGGLGPALLAAVLAVVSTYWAPAAHIADPHAGILHLAGFVRALTYLVTGVLVASLSGARRRTELDLEKSQELFETVLQQMPAGVAMAEAASGKIVFCNERIEQIWRGRVLGNLNVYSARHPDGRPYELSEHPLARSIAAGASVSEEEMEFTRDDGTRGTLMVNSAPIRGRRGQIIAAVATFDDITEYRRAREARQFLGTCSEVLASSLDYEATLQHVVHLAVPALAGICSVQVLDESGNLRRVAIACGNPSREASVRELIHRYPLRPQEPYSALGQVLRTGQPVFEPIVTEQWLAAHARDARQLELFRELGFSSYMCVPLALQGRILGTLVFMASDRRYDRQDLAVAEELARRTAMAVEHARLYREAQWALAAKDRFLAILSHEIRTPLMPVLMATSLLEREAGLSEHASESIGMIRRNVELEVRLIDDLLDLTRISRGKFQIVFQTTDVHAAICSAIEVCQGEIHARQLRLTLELGAKRHHASGDPARLQQVFWNLVKNAIKFTPADGCITIRSSNNEAGKLFVEVADTGIGIRADRLPLIFNAFEQGERDIPGRFGGLGLGLTITRALVEAHGGTITASSPGKDRGTTFTVELPTVQAAVAAAPMPPTPEIALNSKPLRILLVDDHEDTVRILSALLSTYDFRVTTASSVGEALDAAATRDFDLLISDIGLPDGSGNDLMLRLRQRQPIPGIALSGYGMEADVQRSREAGFSEHLVKPIDLAKLEDALRRVVARREANAAGAPRPAAAAQESL